MKKIMAAAAVGLFATTSAAYATHIAPGRIICGNQANLFSFDVPFASGPPVGPFLVKDVDGFISGARPGQTITFVVFAHTLSSTGGDPTTEELFNALIHGVTIADFSGRAPISVHLTSTSATGAMVRALEVACIHLVPITHGHEKEESLDVTLTMHEDPVPQ